LKLHRSEGLQISPKTEEDSFVLTSGILSKPFENTSIPPLRFAYETATFEVSAL
jgi:hypothetical protein